MAVTSYCTLPQLYAWGIRAEALAVFTPEQKDGAIEAASRKIDSYLENRWTLPLVAVGTDLGRCCAIITAYDLLSSKGLAPEGGSDQNIRLRYKDELAWLELVAKGTVTPDLEDSAGDDAGGEIMAPRVKSATSRGYSVRGTGASRGKYQTD